MDWQEMLNKEDKKRKLLLDILENDEGNSLFMIFSLNSQLLTI